MTIAPVCLVLRSNKLLTTSGITDFTLQDVLKPDTKRLRRNLSAVINFVKFHEDRQPGYIELTEQTDTFVQRKAALEEENERLVTEVNEANRQRQQEKPEEEELRADNEKREVTVVRGSYKGRDGKVTQVYRKKYVIHLTNVQVSFCNIIARKQLHLLLLCSCIMKTCNLPHKCITFRSSVDGERQWTEISFLHGVKLFQYSLS